MAKKSSKKQAKEAATAATPPTDEAKAAEAAAAEEKAKAEAEAKAAAETKKQAKEAARTVMVIVGPNGAAGRIVVGKTTYDGVTPRPMAKADYQRLRAQYDLQEAKDS